MAEQIENGSAGSPFRVRVDSDHRMHVHAHTDAFKDHRGEDGHAYNINTGPILMTGFNQTGAMLYIKNNEDQLMVIPKLTYSVGNNQTGNDDYRIEVLRNPTAGNIITDATGVQISSNRNYGSSNTLSDSNIYKGHANAIFTDGDLSISTIFTAPTVSVIDIGNIVLPKGSSLGIQMITQTGDTAAGQLNQNVEFAAEIYLTPEDQ